MARKRRAPSAAPPPPLQEFSAESGSETDEEEPPRLAAAQKPPQNPRPHPPAAAADGADSSEEESGSDADAHAFQMRPVSRTPTKPAAPAPQPGSDADEEEEGESSESEPEVPEPLQKKVAATMKSRTAKPEDKKRPAPVPLPSGGAKKAKAEAGKGAPEATAVDKGKKPAPVQTPSGKAKKPGGKLGLDPSPSSKSEKPARAHRTWSKEDVIKILEAMAAYVKSEGKLPKTDVLLAAVHDHLDRKDCSYTELYEKVRGIKERYKKAVSTGIMPSGDDELRIYNLSEAIWGEKAREAITAAASLNDSTATKSKKGQAKKEKMDGNSKGDTLKEVNQNGDTQKGSKKEHAKTDRDVESKLSKEDTTTGTPSKGNKQRNGKEELGKDAKSGTLKETATGTPSKSNMQRNGKEELGKVAKSGTLKETTTAATQNDDVMTKRKRGKMAKEASTGRQNIDAWTEEVTHQEETEIGASVQGMHRSFDELQNLYPSLAWRVERIEAQHPCGETLKRAFELIGNEKANALESKIKAQRLAEVKAQNRQADLKKEVVNMLISLAD